jgi:hypothetical protein
MKKIIIEEPIYEKVQTGVRKIEKWQTSDGEIHDTKESAMRHEFYEIKLNRKRFYIPELEDATVLNLTCKEDLEKYEEDYIDNEYKIKEYDKDNLQYPNTYVFYEIDESDDNDYYSYPEYHVYCLPLDEFKEMLIKKIQEFK